MLQLATEKVVDVLEDLSEISEQPGRCGPYRQTCRCNRVVLSTTASWQVLLAKGVPGWVVTALQHLYKDVSQRAWIGGEWHDFGVSRNGTKQGCPLSAFLYALLADPLLEVLGRKLSKRGVRAFADDTALLLFDLLSLTIVIRVFRDFARASGLELNLSKTVLVDGGFNSIQDWLLLQSTRWRGVRVVPRARYLGVLVGPCIPSAVQFEACHEKFLKACRYWSPLPLSISLRCLVMRCYLLPILLYVAQFFPLPPDVLKSVRCRVLNFVQGVVYSSHNWLTCLTYKFRLPLDVPDIELMAQAAVLRIHWPASSVSAVNLNVPLPPAGSCRRALDLAHRALFYWGRSREQILPQAISCGSSPEVVYRRPQSAIYKFLVASRATCCPATRHMEGRFGKFWRPLYALAVDDWLGRLSAFFSKCPRFRWSWRWGILKLPLNGWKTMRRGTDYAMATYGHWRCTFCDLSEDSIEHFFLGKSFGKKTSAAGVKCLPLCEYFDQVLAGPWCARTLVFQSGTDYPASLRFMLATALVETALYQWRHAPGSALVPYMVSLFEHFWADLSLPSPRRRPAQAVLRWVRHEGEMVALVPALDEFGQRFFEFVGADGARGVLPEEAPVARPPRGDRARQLSAWKKEQRRTFLQIVPQFSGAAGVVPLFCFPEGDEYLLICQFAGGTRFLALGSTFTNVPRYVSSPLPLGVAVDELRIYTDGSYDRTSSSCGWGFCILGLSHAPNCDGGSVRLADPGHGGAGPERFSSLVGELAAMRAALEMLNRYSFRSQLALFRRVQFFVDSKSALAVLLGSRTSASYVGLIAVCRSFLHSLEGLLPGGLSLTHVYSHTGSWPNDLADELATRGRLGLPCSMLPCDLLSAELCRSMYFPRAPEDD